LFASQQSKLHRTNDSSQALVQSRSMPLTFLSLLSRAPPLTSSSRAGDSPSRGNLIFRCNFFLKIKLTSCIMQEPRLASGPHVKNYHKPRITAAHQAFKHVRLLFIGERPESPVAWSCSLLLYPVPCLVWRHRRLESRWLVSSRSLTVVQLHPGLPVPATTVYEPLLARHPRGFLGCFRHGHLFPHKRWTIRACWSLGSCGGRVGGSEPLLCVGSGAHHMYVHMVASKRYQNSPGVEEIYTCAIVARLMRLVHGYVTTDLRPGLRCNIAVVIVIAFLWNYHPNCPVAVAHPSYSAIFGAVAKVCSCLFPNKNVDYWTTRRRKYGGRCSPNLQRHFQAVEGASSEGLGICTREVFLIFGKPPKGPPWWSMAEPIAYRAGRQVAHYGDHNRARRRCT